MSKVIMRDEDSQVIHMVNANTAYRRAKAAEEEQQRIVLTEDRAVRDTDFQRRKDKVLRVAETAGKAALGLGFVAAVQFEFVVGWMGAAMALVCFVWAAAGLKRGKV